MASFVLTLAPHTFYHFRCSAGYVRAFGVASVCLWCGILVVVPGVL